MNIFENTVVTRILPPLTVFSKKGRNAYTKNRPYFGLSFCMGGQITYEHRGETYISNPGNAILLPKGATYTLHGDKEGSFPIINFDCENLNTDSFLIIPINDSEKYINDVRALSDLFLFDDKKLKQFQLFYAILDRVGSEQWEIQQPLSAAIDYIERYFSDPTLTNSLLAEKLEISEVYLRKLFTAHLQTTPKQYILHIRLNKAKQFLTDSAYNVTEIAEKCGFSSLYHFCRIFKDKTGSTPSEYAKAHKTYKI